VVAVVGAGIREGATSRVLFVEIMLTVFLSRKVFKKGGEMINELRVLICMSSYV